MPLTNPAKINISAGAASANLSKVTFSNASGVSWGLNASNITASVKTDYALSNHSHGDPTLFLTNLSGTTASNSAGFTLSLSAGAGGAGLSAGMSTNGNTSGDTGLVTGRLALMGGNNITLSGSTNGGSMSLTISAANLAAAGAHSEGISNVGNTAGTSGVVTDRMVFVGTNALTLSQSVNGGSATITFVMPPPLSQWQNAVQISMHGSVQGNSLVSVAPLLIQYPLVFSQAKVGGNISVATAANNSSAYADLTLSVVFYSLNGSTLSSIFSGNGTMTASRSSNATGSVTGLQQFTATFAQTTLNPGVYWMAAHVSTNNTATGGANTTALGNSITMMVPGPFADGSGAVSMRQWGVGTNDSQGAPMGVGIISTGATRATIGLSDLVVTGSRGVLAKLYVELANTSVW